jgi:hypothetical protein
MEYVRSAPPIQNAVIHLSDNCTAGAGKTVLVYVILGLQVQIFVMDD